jgi:hypothetical protein
VISEFKKGFSNWLMQEYDPDSKEKTKDYVKYQLKHFAGFGYDMGDFVDIYIYPKTKKVKLVFNASKSSKDTKTFNDADKDKILSWISNHINI